MARDVTVFDPTTGRKSIARNVPDDFTDAQVQEHYATVVLPKKSSELAQAKQQADIEQGMVDQGYGLEGILRNPVEGAKRIGEAFGAAATGGLDSEMAQSVGNLGKGVARGVEGFVPGTVQALTPSDWQVNKEATAYIDMMAGRDKDLMDTWQGQAGNIYGGAIPAMLSGAGLTRIGQLKQAPQAVQSISTALRASPVKGGAVGGAGTGYTTGLTSEEQKDPGARAANTAIGALLGGAVPAGVAVAKAGGKLLPGEAAERFARDVVGYSDEAGRTGPTEEFVESVGGKYDALKKEAKARYAAEESVEAPPVDVSDTRNLLKTGMNSEVDKYITAMSPRVKKLTDAMSSGNRSISFGEVRELSRELKQAPKSIKSWASEVQKSLDSDLQRWGATAPEADEAVKAAKATDAWYRKEVAPLEKGTLKKVIGPVKGEATFPPGAIEANLLGRSAGRDIKDLVSRVPGAEEPLRKLYGANIAEGISEHEVAKALRGSPIDVLLSKQEREYAEQIIPKLAGSADDESAWLTKLLRSTEKIPGTSRINRAAYGIQPYGAKEATRGTGVLRGRPAYEAARYYTSEDE